MSILKDSGERRQFASGAVRDIANGKGRCDLLPLDVIAQMFGEGDLILQHISSYIRTGKATYLYRAMHSFIQREYNGDKYEALLELSKHMEDGARKYSERNWEKGIPLHAFIDSGVRHYLKYLRGDNDEPHARAFMWNMVCCVWTQKHHPELIDLPFVESEKGGEVIENH